MVLINMVLINHGLDQLTTFHSSCQGSYVVKEEIQKPPKHDHPCNLTLTAVKISFPEMKSEVFMNLLGYKEPNLVHLMRCKVQSTLCRV